jgi:hypothetical protein
MDLILGTLSELKAHLLNGALQSDTSYDAALAALGRGVAERMQGHCNRQFPRLAGATFEFPADRDHVILPRAPVEALTSIELRETLALGWVDQGAVNDLVVNYGAASGLVEFGVPLGARGTRGRITYTGGYWIDLSGSGSSSAKVSLTAGIESLAVTFPNRFNAAPRVQVSIIPPDGGTIIIAAPSAVTVDGFTALFGFPIPATGYFLQWAAFDDAQPTLAGTTSPASAAESQAITFGLTFAAAPLVELTLVQPIIVGTASAVTTTGFTALFASALPASGYALEWRAYAGGDAVPSATQPSGSTARPADLYYAWLLQCERVWSVRDKLGVNIGGGAQPTFVTMTLAALELVPEVKETLRRYTRHALT